MRVRLNMHKKMDIIIAYAPPASNNKKDTPTEVKETIYDELQTMVENGRRNSEK